MVPVLSGNLFFALGPSRHPGVVTSVAGPVAAAAAVTAVMNIVAGLLVARLHGDGAQPAADIATTLVARGEFALILGATAAGAGLDARLAPFVAGYVLVLAVLGPVAAGRAQLPARALGSRRPRPPGDGTAPEPAPVAVGAERER